jgi:hypothetical protein
MLVASHAGAVERLRDRHRSRPDGSCAGCGPAWTPWPCVQITIADRAARMRG